MVEREDVTDKLLQHISYKLVRQSEEYNRKMEWYNDKDEIGGKVGEVLTLGSEENVKTLIGASIIPGACIAVGLASLAAGLIVVFPTIVGPETEAEAEAFKELIGIGDKVFDFSNSSFLIGLKTAIAPLGIATLSIPKKLFRDLTYRVDDKYEPLVDENEKIQILIKDYLEGKEDPSLEFFKAFVRRVDLQDNSDEFNLELLRWFTRYREKLISYNERPRDREREQKLNHTFESLLNFLEEGLKSKMTSRNFKNNRFVKLLVQNPETREKYYEEGISARKR